MGNGVSHLFPCLNRPHPGSNRAANAVPSFSDEDEALGHSFCYVRSSNRFLSPDPSLRFSPNSSLRFSPEPAPKTRPAETGFKSISGASVSANTSIPKSVLQLENLYDDATKTLTLTGGFESSASFASLPLQPAPRPGPGQPDPDPDRTFFMSGPIERGALSGPIEQTVPFSAPLNAGYLKRRKKKGVSGIRKAFSRSFSEKKRPWVVPVRNFRKQEEKEEKERESDNVQWAVGAAGEDRVHVVVSEQHGWLFVGIYDGFNGPDGPEFLMGNLYKAMYNQLEGLFWDNEGNSNYPQELSNSNTEIVVADSENNDNVGPDRKRVTFQSDEIRVRRRRLWEYLAEDDRDEGLDLSGSDRYAFSVDDALSVGNAGSAVSRSSLLLSRLKHGFVRRKESGKLFAWSFKEKREEGESRTGEDDVAEREERAGRKRRVGPVDHEEVLRAMSRALEATELAYLDMTDKFLDQNPELALMGSCLLVVLMREEDVYVMNVGDSRAIVAQFSREEISTSRGSKEVVIDDGISGEDIVEEVTCGGERDDVVEASKDLAQNVRLSALQLSTDHSTSIEEEIIRIKNEHPDDSHCIVNDRVKGRLKVTRAFGAGFLKQPKWNDAMLEMFRNEYIGTAPYLSCSPSLRHHKLCPRDQFLVLSSDGLYQYFSNQEVVAEVENFMEKFPDGDPAQHLIEELLLRAAKKAGMELHELLDIPQGDRRKYHDDVTVMVISLEGRIWKSSGKYL